MHKKRLSIDMYMGNAYRTFSVFSKKPAGIFILAVFPFLLYSQSGMISKSDSYTTPFHDNSYEVKGDPLLFENSWAHGRVELSGNKILKNDSLFYNYNKMAQSLLVTKDFKTMMTVPKENFKSVTFLWRDSVYILEHVDLINSRDLFFELLRDDEKYSLYKNILTAFNDVNFHTNGLVSEGNTYASFQDHSTYYIVLQNKTYKRLTKTDRKSIEKVFASSPDSERAKAWLEERKQTEGEMLLLDLVLFLNKKE